MAWIEGSLERTYTIDAPHEEVVEFFTEPGEFKSCFGEMESGEEIEEGVWHWVLEEKSEKGVTFQGDWVVEYDWDGEEFTWSTREGNTRSRGSTTFRDLGGSTEVSYEEHMEVDLPINRLVAKVFGRIVGREVSQGIGDFLDCAKETLESR
jgi:uncharacterized membrane protein